MTPPTPPKGAPTPLLLILANVLDMKHPTNPVWLKKLNETPMTSREAQSLQDIVLNAVASGLDSGLEHLRETRR